MFSINTGFQVKPGMTAKINTLDCHVKPFECFCKNIQAVLLAMTQMLDSKPACVDKSSLE